MRERLLAILREPGTCGPLEVRNAVLRHDEVWSGLLYSAATGERYTIRDAIPRFVPPSVYAETFGFQWNRFARVQLDSATGATYSRDRFLNETGWTESELRDQLVLDAGCGSGRFTEVCASMGAQVVALDYSSAIDAAARNLARFESVDLVQGDLLRPPFEPGTFDRVYSIGVLQHTPDPAAALASALRLLRHGGKFAFTIYARRWYTKLHSKYVLRPVTRRMPPERLLSWIEAAMPVLFPVTDVLFRLPVIGRAARFVLPIANYPERMAFSREQRYNEAVLDTLDMLSPTYDSPMTAAEVETVLATCGTSTYGFRSRVPIVITGIKA